MQHILLPIAGLQSDERVLEYVMRESRREGSRIHLLNVQPPIMINRFIVFPTAEILVGSHRAAGEEVLRPAQALFDANGIYYTARVLLGDPAKTIVRYAAERSCNRIVMSTKGRSAIGKLILGSVAAWVINGTSIPVTLIRQANEDAGKAPGRRVNPRVPARAKELAMNSEYLCRDTERESRSRLR